MIRKSATSLIETSTGRLVDILHPHVEDIEIEDIAHALSQQCRYGGHCKGFYSVAEHSVKVSKHAINNCDVRYIYHGMELEHSDIGLMGLLHDASEAYLVDIPTPVKNHLEDYKAIECRLMDVIFARFNIPVLFEELPQVILDSDHNILYQEAHTLLTSGGRNFSDYDKMAKNLVYEKQYAAKCWAPRKARRMFLQEYYNLEFSCAGF